MFATKLIMCSSTWFVQPQIVYIIYKRNFILSNLFAYITAQNVYKIKYGQQYRNLSFFAIYSLSLFTIAFWTTTLLNIKIFSERLTLGNKKMWHFACLFNRFLTPPSEESHKFEFWSQSFCLYRTLFVIEILVGKFSFRIHPCYFIDDG